MYTEWKSFAENFPIANCGLLIIIKSFNDFYDVKDHLFYGYVFPDSHYIYIVFDITTNTGMGWKAHKEHDEKDMYWYYVSEFSETFNNELKNLKDNKG